MTATNWVVVEPDQARRAPFGPYEVVVRLAGEQTNGALALLEYTADEGATDEDHHAQTREDLAVLVLDGAATFVVGDQTIVAGPGTAFFVPRGVPLSRRTVTISPARYLFIATPAGLDQFFIEASQVLRDLPADSTMVDIVAAGMAVREKYGIVTTEESSAS